MSRVLLALAASLTLGTPACRVPSPTASTGQGETPVSTTASPATESPAAATVAPQVVAPQDTTASAPIAPSRRQLDTNGLVPANPANLHAVDLESLRRNHPVRNEGAACTDDQQCDSPLRCVAAMCGFPAAMTGQRDDRTPSIVFFAQAGEAHYDLEVARQPHEQMRGLMHRQTMAPNWGMVFVFPNMQPRSFWMRNTLMPLDMVFVTDAGVVDSVVANAVPLTLDSRPSAGPAKYVIELVAGEAARRGIVAGTRVEFLNLATP